MSNKKEKFPTMRLEDGTIVEAVATAGEAQDELTTAVHKKMIEMMLQTNGDSIIVANGDGKGNIIFENKPIE